MKKAFTDQGHPAETAEILPEYDFSGGVRGKYARDFRQGYTVKVHRRDGTVETRREEGSSLFRDYGYLSGEAQKAAADIEARHADFFEFFYRSSSLAQRLLLDLCVPVRDTQKLVVAGLMARLLEDSQGCALLAKHGIVNTSAVTLRSSFESLVLLKNCCANTSFVERFLESDVLRRLKLSQAVQKYADLDDEQEKERAFLHAELETAVKAKNIKRLRIEALAREAGLEGYYETIYRLTSCHAHVSPRSLESYYPPREGKVKEFVFGPNDEITDVYLYTLSDFLLIGAGCTSQFFALNRERLVSEVRAEHGRLSPKWPEELNE